VQEGGAHPAPGPGGARSEGIQQEPQTGGAHARGVSGATVSLVSRLSLKQENKQTHGQELFRVLLMVSLRSRVVFAGVGKVKARPGLPSSSP